MMNTNYRLIKFMLALLILLISAGCTANYTRTYASSIPTPKLFLACKSAVVAAGFAVTSSNSTDGFIDSEQSVVMGSGSVVHLSVQIHAVQSNKKIVEAILTPPLGTLGDFSGILNDFERSLRKQVSDVEIVSHQAAR